MTAQSFLLWMSSLDLSSRYSFSPKSPALSWTTWGMSSSFSTSRSLSSFFFWKDEKLERSSKVKNENLTSWWQETNLGVRCWLVLESDPFFELPDELGLLFLDPWVSAVFSAAASAAVFRHLQDRKANNLSKSIKSPEAVHCWENSSPHDVRFCQDELWFLVLCLFSEGQDDRQSKLSADSAPAGCSRTLLIDPTEKFESKNFVLLFKEKMYLEYLQLKV